jgi:hypothetical protein
MFFVPIPLWPWSLARQVWGWAVAILDNDHDIWSLVRWEWGWGSYPQRLPTGPW